MGKNQYQIIAEAYAITYHDRDDPGNPEKAGVVEEYERKPSLKTHGKSTTLGALGGAALGGGVTAAYGHHKYMKAKRSGASKKELHAIKQKYAKRAALAAGIGAGIGGGAGFSNATRRMDTDAIQKGYNALNKGGALSNVDTVNVCWLSPDNKKAKIKATRHIKDGKVI